MAVFNNESAHADPSLENKVKEDVADANAPSVRILINGKIVRVTPCTATLGEADFSLTFKHDQRVVFASWNDKRINLGVYSMSDAYALVNNINEVVAGSSNGATRRNHLRSMLSNESRRKLDKRV